MKKFFLLVICFVFASASTFSQDSDKKVKVDLEKMAVSLVNECANIQEGEIVMVSGSVRDLELLENIAVNVRKLGAFPLLTISSDRMTKRMFTDVPEKFDTQYPKLGMKMVDMITAQISVSSGENPDLLADVPPERFATRSKANKPLIELYQEKEIKSVSLGNGLYPTEALAAKFNMSYDELFKVFWEAIDVDYARLNEIGSIVQQRLKNADILKITHKNGTDFTVDITGNKPFISDGIISDEDMKKGLVGMSAYLPAGEVYFVPVAGTANGKLVFDNYIFRGEIIKDLELVFENGNLVSMDGKHGIEKLKEYYDAQDDLIKEFSMIDFGINPNIEIPSTSTLVSYIPAGTITVGIGNNTWAGGENNSISGLNFFLDGSTVQAGERLLIREGELLYE